LQPGSPNNSSPSSSLSDNGNSAASTPSNTSSCIGDVGDNVIISGNSNKSLNFSAIWSAAYDLPGVTLDEVLADLDLSSSIVAHTLDFFESFFGPYGYVTLNTTASEINQDFGPPIDDALTDVALWLMQNVQ